MTNFEKLQGSGIEVSKFVGREMVVSYHVPPAAVGDFLSRLWSLFGEPNVVGNEGFYYDLKHKQSGISFSAYSGGSGPSYGHLSNSNDESLLIIVRELESELEKTYPADCEIQYETDFGLMTIGCNNGIPYEKVIESN